MQIASHLIVVKQIVVFSFQLPTGILLAQWVRELNPTHPERSPPSVLEAESSEVKLYQVLDHFHPGAQHT
jgi:hypothetical protein